MATKSTPQTQRATDAQCRSQALGGEPKTHRQPVEPACRDATENPGIIYSPRSETTPESELASLAAVYALVIQAHQQKKAAAPATRRRKEVDPEERRQGQEQ